MSSDEREGLLDVESRPAPGGAGGKQYVRAGMAAADTAGEHNYAGTIVLAVLSIIAACGTFMLFRMMPIFMMFLALFRGETWQWVGMLTILLAGPVLGAANFVPPNVVAFISSPTGLLVVILPIWFGADPSADYGFCNAAVFAVMLCGMFAMQSFGKLHWSPWGGPGKKMRIMLVGDSFEPKVDGVSTFTTHTIKELVSKGHTVCVVTSVGTEDTLHGARVIRLPGIGIELHKGHSLTLPSVQLLSALREFKPNVLHIFEGCIPIGFYTGLLCRMLGVPHVTTQHTRIDLYWKRYLPFIPEWCGDSIIMMIFSAA